MAEKDERISVLIVDDDRWTTRAISYALVAEPDLALLPAAHSGHHAVELYRRFRPDVVLMDIHMPPGMSGIDATQAIKTLDPDAVVVVLSTISPGPGIARALEAGAVAAVNKTASEATLRVTVRRAARGEDPAMLRFLARDIMVSGESLPGVPGPSPQLSDRELDVLTLICRGRGYEEIAQIHDISVWTVKTHTRRLREKLHAENLAQLVVRSLQYRFYSV